MKEFLNCMSLLADAPEDTMPNLKSPYRQDVRAAWEQLEIEERQFDECSQREARRMVYRPRPTYISLLPFFRKVKKVAIFILTIGLLIIAIIGVMSL